MSVFKSEKTAVTVAVVAVVIFIVIALIAGCSADARTRIIPVYKSIKLCDTRTGQVYHTVAQRFGRKWGLLETVENHELYDTQVVVPIHKIPQFYKVHKKRSMVRCG